MQRNGSECMFEGDNNEMVCGVYCDVDDIFFHENVNIFRRRVEFQWMKSVCGSFGINFE